MSGYGNAEIPNLFLILVTTYKLNGKSGIQFVFIYINLLHIFFGLFGAFLLITFYIDTMSI